MNQAVKGLELNPFCQCGAFGTVRPIARFEIVHKQQKVRQMHDLPLNFVLCPLHSGEMERLDSHVFAPAVRASIAQQLKPAHWMANFNKREIVLQPTIGGTA